MGRRGRPPTGNPRMKKSSVTLPDEHLRRLLAMGHGNISRAIRTLVEEAWPDLKAAPTGRPRMTNRP